MTRCFQWLSLFSSMAVIISMTLTGWTTEAKAAPTRHSDVTVSKVEAKTAAAVRCKTRNKPSGTITWSDWQFPDTFSQYTGAGLAVSQLNMNLIYDGLLLYDDKAQLQPDMLSRIPTLQNGDIKQGGRLITLRLKQGIKWSNGTEITSHDVKFGWQIASDKATGPACYGSCDAIRSIDTPDKFTAVLHMKRVYSAAIPYAVEFPIWPTVWPNAWNNNPHKAALKLEDPGFNFENSSYPTSGPYQVAQFVRDNRVVFKPMKYYNILACGARVKTVIFSAYANVNTMVAAAALKATDMTQDYTLADLKLLNSHRGPYAVHSQPSFSFEHFEMNADPTFQHKPNPLANVKVRLAIALAFNKLGMIRNALGVSSALAKQIVAWTPLGNSPQLHQPFADPKITGQWDPIAGRYRSDTGSAGAIADARKLLSQTPYAGGFTLQASTTTGRAHRAAQLAALAQDLKKLNITVVTSFVSSDKYFAGWDQGGTLDHGAFQLADFAFLGQPDPDQLKSELMQKYCDRKQKVHSDTNQNYSCASNSIIDRSFTRGAASFNRAVRRQAYSAVQSQLNMNAIWIPLYSQPTIVTVDNKLINFKNNPTLIGPTWNAYEWASRG